jgi:hypothetical protein
LTNSKTAKTNPRDKNIFYNESIRSLLKGDKMNIGLNEKTNYAVNIGSAVAGAILTGVLGILSYKKQKEVADKQIAVLDGALESNEIIKEHDEIVKEYLEEAEDYKK